MDTNLHQNHLKNILVVDDSQDNLFILSSILQKKGYQVSMALNGKNAIEMVSQNSIDVILLDIMMPDMTGYEVCTYLKQNQETADIPIIFMSALDEVNDKIKAFKLGGIDYVSKPFQHQEILVRVEQQLELRGVEKQLKELNSQLEKRVEERTLQLEQANAELLKMTFHDPLTGLLNRAALMQQLDLVFQQTLENPDYRCAVLCLDCDRFKRVNDSLGHFLGDELLTAIGQRLQSFANETDTVARLGGDEFAILLTNLETYNPLDVADQILESFNHPFPLGVRTIFINVSIGIAISNSSYQKPEELLRDADTAMYEAKALGKGRYQVFKPEMYQYVLRRLQLETDLRTAIKNDELTVYYQPIVALETGRIIGFESLVRWQHPTQGFLSPNLFIPIAEETGLIARIGEWVLRESCQQLSYWNQQNLTPHPLSISVNLSALQFAQPNLIEQIDRILETTQLNPESLNLEITESAILDHPETASDILKQLRQRKIKLSIDDFGTGYSSLSYLHSFPVNTLKIDRSFISPINDDPQTLGLVPVILSLVQTMGMNVIAEGIETQQQLNQLRKLKCHAGQGYLFSKPVDHQTATDLIQSSPQW